MPVRFLLGVLVETIFAQRSTQHVVRHATWWRKCAAWQAPCGNETDARTPTSWTTPVPLWPQRNWSTRFLT